MRLWGGKLYIGSSVLVLLNEERIIWLSRTVQNLKLPMGLWLNSGSDQFLFFPLCVKIYPVDLLSCLCLDIMWKWGWVSNETGFCSCSQFVLDFFRSDHNNRTALHVAAMRGSKRCVECILKHHPQSINLLDKNLVSLHGVQYGCLRNQCQVRSDKMKLWVSRFGSELKQNVLA